MKEFDKKIKSKKSILKGIGMFEIFGGVIGLNITLFSFIENIKSDYKILIILLFAILFYSYSILAGIFLIKKSENGILHSQILQYFQIFAISFGGITYLLISGAYIFIGYNLTSGNLGLKFSLFSEFQINLINSDQDSFVFLNILPIIILNLIESSKKVIFTETIKKENYWKNITG